jgi:hypothetical protein
VTDDLRRTAIHESGHAVIAELLYLNPEYVTIEPTYRADGHLKRRIPPTSAQERWRELLFLCSGVVAEGIRSDEVEPYEELSWQGGEGTDSARLWASLRTRSDDPRQQQVWFDSAFFQAQRILSNSAVWRSVESLAERLMEQRTLNGWEAADLIDAALGNSKWGRDRFKMVARYASPPTTWIESREEYRQAKKAMAASAAGGAAK